MARVQVAKVAAAAMLLVLIANAVPAATASTGWTFGPLYEAKREVRVDGGRHCTAVTYWRTAYFNGVRQFEEFVRTDMLDHGPVWTFGPEFVASSRTFIRGTGRYREEVIWRKAFYCGQFKCHEHVGTRVTYVGEAWTFGPEFVASRTSSIQGSVWVETITYWRRAYLDGVFQFSEFVRAEVIEHGSVWTHDPPQLSSVTVTHARAPHLFEVRQYTQQVRYRGQPHHTIVRDDLREWVDIDQVVHGEPVVTGCAPDSATGVLRLQFGRAIYHRNHVYGQFAVGMEALPAYVRSLPLAAIAVVFPGLPLSHGALRIINTAADFDDYGAIATSKYFTDIVAGLENGLIVGKSSDTSRYYAPDEAIALGEMVNILARNAGAEPMTQGTDAVQYLAGKGVSMPSGSLASLLTEAQLSQLAHQVVSLPSKSRLVVVEDAVAGLPVFDLPHGLSRGKAVSIRTISAANPEPAGRSTPPASPGPPTPPLQPAGSIVGSVIPSATAPLGTITLRADVSGTAARVSVRVPWLTAPLALTCFHRGPVEVWQVPTAIPVDLADGRYWVHFVASLQLPAQAELTDTVALTVHDPFTVSGRLIPAQCAPGGSVLIEAFTAPTAKLVSASTPAGTAALDGGATAWSGWFVLPADMSPGQVIVTIDASSHAGKQARASLTLQVQTGSSEYDIILTD